MDIFMNKRFIKSNNKGITLVEIILATAILGIICIAFLPVMTNGFKIISHSKNMTETQDNAKLQIETWISGGPGPANSPIPESMTINFYDNNNNLIKSA